MRKPVVVLPGIRYAVMWMPGASTVDASHCEADEFTRLYGVRP